MTKILHDEAFTGLEAAIVLIAFVVVAAVFAYVVLGAGFFTTQKSQEVVHTGVAQASSNMQILGDVYGLSAANFGGTTQCIDHVNFTIGLAAGGASIDLNKVTMSWQNKTQYVELARMSPLLDTAPAASSWSVLDRVNSNANDILEKGESIMVTVNLNQPGTCIVVNDAFNLEIRPELGAALGIKRDGPPAIELVNMLY